jgi:cytochrome b561
MKQVSRYHPPLVTLHWVLAALIIAELTLGFFAHGALSHSKPRNVGILQMHTLGGILILVLMVIRFVCRIWTPVPANAVTGRPQLNRIAPVTHYAFYVLVLLMAGTGLATAVVSGFSEIVFDPSGPPLPRMLTIHPTFVAHAVTGKLLICFVVLHVLAACYHQFIRKEALFQRMFFS